MQLDEDALADIEGDADLLLRLARVDDDEPPDVVALARSMTGRAPYLSRRGPEAHLARIGDGHQVCLRAGLQAGRARWLVGHELAELHYRRTGYQGEDIEARCDALGAALVAPRRAVRAAIRAHAHRVHALARALAVTQSTALLRIGEVAGRPVVLVRAAGLVARGDAFPWPPSPMRAPPGSHPLRITDEPARWGLMAA